MIRSNSGRDLSSPARHLLRDLPLALQFHILFLSPRVASERTACFSASEDLAFFAYSGSGNVVFKISLVFAGNIHHVHRQHCD